MRQYLRENGPALTASVLLALGLKLAYSRLGPDQLTWMTGPTQALVSLVTGVDFTYEEHYGYVNLAHRLVIAKSCAGINYLMAAFGMLSFTVIPRMSGGRRKLLLVGPLAGLAYATTVLVNSLRIALGLVLHDAGFSWGWLTPARVHRTAGIAVYFLALVAVQALVKRALTRSPDAGHGPGRLIAAPLLWYGLIALALPFLNGALLARPRLFAEHAAWVSGVTLLLAGGFSLLTRRRGASRGGPAVGAS